MNILIDGKFRSSCLDIDYNRTQCSGSCEDYCRCSKIYNITISKVYLEDITEKIAKETKINFNYISRICSALKLWQPECWYVNCCGGYYGEEIDYVTLESIHLHKLNAILDKIKDKSLSDIIPILLELEYSYLLPELISRTWTEEVIDFSNVIFGVGDFDFWKSKTLSSNVYNENYVGNIGVLIPSNGGGFRLIDGHHRFSAVLNKHQSGYFYVGRYE